jgi:hypothetical protein
MSTSSVLYVLHAGKIPSLHGAASSKISDCVVLRECSHDTTNIKARQIPSANGTMNSPTEVDGATNRIYFTIEDHSPGKTVSEAIIAAMNGGGLQGLVGIIGVYHLHTKDGQAPQYLLSSQTHFANASFSLNTQQQTGIIYVDCILGGMSVLNHSINTEQLSSTANVGKGQFDVSFLNGEIRNHPMGFNVSCQTMADALAPIMSTKLPNSIPATMAGG